MPLFRKLKVVTEAGAPAQIDALTGSSVHATGGITSDQTVTGANGNMSGPSRSPKRFLLQATDADRTILPSQFDVFLLPNGVWTASRTLTLSHSGANSGSSEIEVINQDQAHQIVVVDPSFGTIDTVAVAPDAQHTIVRRYLFTGTTFIIIH